MGLAHFGEVGVVECDADDGDGLVVVWDAGFFFEGLGEVGVHIEGDVGDVGEGPGQAVAGEGVEAAGVVAGCLGCDAVALDDGGSDACLGEVVCGGCAHRAAADDCYVGCGCHGFLPVKLTWMDGMEEMFHPHPNLPPSRGKGLTRWTFGLVGGLR